MTEVPDVAGRVAIVTGVSRRAGIGFAVAGELLAAGASVLVHSWSPHDAEQPWGADPAGDAGIVALLGGEGARLRHVAADFADPRAPGLVVSADVVVANHARSSNNPSTRSPPPSWI